MIDIHCHILSGIDDGAPHEQASLKMARRAVEQGITGIIATPHHRNGTYENTKPDIIKKVNNLNEVLMEEGIPIEIHPGQEPRIYGEILEDYEKGEILSLNDGGSYLFIEFPFDHVPRYSGQLLYDVQLKGLTPVIVHPERNREIIKSPKWIYQLVKGGALTQITSSSITGHFGKEIKRLSYELIEHNLTHFVASDAHNVTGRDFRLREAYREIEHEFGVETRFFLQENSELLLEGKGVAREVPYHIKRKKILGLF